MKKLLSGVLIAASLLIAVAAWRFSSAYSASVQPRSFSVQGTGKATAIPDVAQFSFSVITEGGRDIAALQSDNVAKTNRAIAYVKSAGVDAKDIRTQSFDISPRYQNYACPPVPVGTNARPCPPSQIVGYTITQSVSVKVRDFAKAGDILSGVANAGANSVSQLNFTVDNPSAVQNQARAKAVEDALGKAQTIAASGKFHIGRIISIDDSSVQPYYGYGAYSTDMSKAAPPAPTIEPGSQDITANVSVRYEIQ